ncbi:MAG: carbonic anhydrase [Stellaceae bacterium]
MHAHAPAGFSCSCGDDVGTTQIGRRGLLLGAGAALALPRFALAASGDYEAMIVGCIDPRLQTPVRNYAVKRGLTGKYSQFTIAGAAIGAVAPKFDDWHKAFWDNLAITIDLHKIKSLIAIDHRDCGAAKVAYGDDCCSTREKEDATHKAALAEFRKEVGERQPNLKVETLLMALDGTYIPLG